MKTNSVECASFSQLLDRFCLTNVPFDAALEKCELGPWRPISDAGMLTFKNCNKY